MWNGNTTTPRGELLKLFLKWSVPDVLNDKLFEESLSRVPDSFESLQQWESIQRPLLYEEVRATVARCVSNVEDYQETECNIREFADSFRGEQGSSTICFQTDIFLLGTEETNDDDDDDEQDVNDEDDENNQQIRSLVGLITCRTRKADGTFDGPFAANNAFFIKVLLVDDVKKKKKPSKGRDCIWICSSSLEVITTYTLENWTLYIFPSLSLVPFERIERGLGEVSQLSESNSLVYEFLSSRFNGTLLPDDSVPPIATVGNESQKLSIDKVVEKANGNHCLPSIQLIHGPPGTGKSTTIINVIYQQLSRNHPVCATAPTNFAVCEIARRAVLKAKEINFQLRDIVICGTQSRLKLDDCIGIIHIDGRVNRLSKALGRLAGNIGLLWQYTAYGRYKNLEEVLTQCKADIDVIVLESPRSLLNDNRLEELKMLNEKLTLSLFMTIDARERALLMSLVSLGLSPKVDLKSMIISDCMLLFSTVSTFGSLNRRHVHKFRHIIVDEATQLVDAATAMLLSPELRQLILVGDDMQLPSTVISPIASTLGYKTSLFERLKKSNFPSTMLKVQYRMHPHISEWPSTKFYDGQLANGENVQSEEYQKFWHDKFPPIQIYNVDDGFEETDNFGSKYNRLEVNIVIKIVREFSGLIEKNRKSSDREFACTLGIISPYAEQTRLLRLEIDTLRFPSHLQIMCSSVDAFQGKECDVVIFSSVRAGGSLGFVSDMKRFNVAITRAKFSLVIVGNLATLSKDKQLAGFLKYAKHLDRLNSVIIRASYSLLQSQEAQQENLWNGQHQLFENSRWAGCIRFTNEFVKSVQAVKDEKLKGGIFKYLLHLARGRWPKRDNDKAAKVDEIMTDIVYVRPFSSVNLIWHVAVKTTVKGNTANWSQEIKIINIVSSDKLDRYLKHRTAKDLLCKTEKFREFCRERLIQNQLICPKSAYVDPLEASGTATKDLTHISVENGVEDVITSIEKTYSLSSEVAKLLLNAKSDETVQLPHDMSGDEQELICSTGPHFVLGRSGTGKTTVMLYRMVQNERQIATLVTQGHIVEGEFKQLLVTASPVLATAIRESYKKLSMSGKQDPLLHIQQRSLLQSGNKTSVYSLNQVSAHEFPMITTFDALLRMIDLCLPQPFQFLGHSPEKLIDFVVFESRYFSQLGDVSKEGRFKVESAILFKEIISIIKGSIESVQGKNRQHSGCSCMSREEYVALSSKRASNLSPEERHHFYDLFEKYETLKARGEDQNYDASDFAAYVYLQLNEVNCLQMRFQALFVDEVQDLTMLQIAILRFCCSEWNGFFFAGDTAQTIAQGVAFRFESLKDLFYNDFVPYFQKSLKSAEARDAVKVPTVKQLRQNFRTHLQILQLANTVIKLLLHFFPDSMDKVDDELSLQSGPKPIFLKDTVDVVSNMFQRGNMQNCEFGSEQVILVRDKTTQAKVKTICGSNALVLTVYECKGMEFSDVLIYNFFSSSQLGNLWRVIANAFNPVFDMNVKDYPCPTFNDKTHFALCQELKMLYVLITRAKQRVFIFEEDEKLRKVIVGLWTHENVTVVNLEMFNDEMKAVLTVKSTPEEWCNRGQEFFQRRDYENARLCFQRGGDGYNMKLCDAKLYQCKAEELAQSNITEANKFYNLAAQTLEQEPLKNVHDAAVMYEKGHDYAKAGKLYSETQQYSQAAECFIEIKQWPAAAQNFVMDRKIPRAVDCYFKIPDYHAALCTVDDARDILAIASSQSREMQITLDPLRTTCIKNGAEYYYSKRLVDEMLHFVKRMDSLEEKRLFLHRRRQFQALIDMELKEGNFDYVAKIYKNQGKYRAAADAYSKGKESCSLQWIDCKLILFRLENINEDLLPIQVAGDKALKTYKDKHLLPLLRHTERAKQTSFEFEIKFWLNEVQGLKLSSFLTNKTKSNSSSGNHDDRYKPSESLATLFASYPECLNLRLPWIFTNRLLSTASSDKGSTVPWVAMNDVLVFFDEQICATIESLVTKLSTPLPKLSETELGHYYQLLDLFGLRIPNESKFPTMLGVQTKSENGENIQKLWQTVASQLDVSEVITGKDDEKTILELPFKTALKGIHRFIERQQLQYHNVLYAKAKRTWKEELLDDLKPATQFHQFYLWVESGGDIGKLQDTSKQKLKLPLSEKYQMLIYLINAGNREESESDDPDNKSNKERTKLANQVIGLATDDVFFPITYFTSEAVTDSSNATEEVAMEFKDLLLDLYPLSNRFQHNSKHINFEKHAKDILMMDNMSHERTKCTLSLLKGSVPSNHFNSYLNNLWKGKELEIAACEVVSVSTEEKPKDLKKAIQLLIDAQSCKLRFLQAKWDTEDSPFFLGQKKDKFGVVSPFTFIQLLEQTLFVLLLLRNGGSNHLFITEKMLEGIVLRSSHMTQIVNIIVECHRKSILSQKDMKAVEKKAGWLAGTLLNTLTTPFQGIEEWFECCSKNSILSNGRAVYYNDVKTATCFFMRGMHMMILYHLNTNEFGIRINEPFEANAASLNHLPKVYLDYLRLRKFSKSTPASFAELCIKLGDGLLEVRVDTWKTESNAKSANLKKRILHVSDEDKNLCIMTIDEYEQWEELQREKEKLRAEQESTSNTPAVEGQIDKSLADNQTLPSEDETRGIVLQKEEGDVEDDRGEEDETRQIEEIASEARFFRVYAKLMELAATAKAKCAAMTPKEKLRRNIEKDLLQQYDRRRVDPIVEFYMKNIFETYCSLFLHFSHEIEKLSQMLSQYSEVLAGASLLDDLYGIIDSFSSWIDRLSPGTMFDEIVGSNDAEEAMTTNMLATCSKIQDSMERACGLISQAKQLLKAHEDEIASKSVKNANSNTTKKRRG